MQPTDLFVTGMNIHDNVLSGGFAYGIGIGLAKDLTVQNNRFENAKFVRPTPA